MVLNKNPRGTLSVSGFLHLGHFGQVYTWHHWGRGIHNNKEVWLAKLIYCKLNI